MTALVPSGAEDVHPGDIRQVVLSVLVEQDRDDLTVQDDGVHLKSVDGIVPWETMTAMAPPSWTWDARTRLVTDFLNGAVWAVQPLPLLEGTLRVHGELTSSVHAPAGDTWAVEPIHGGVLTLGWGATGVDPDRPDRVVPIADAIWSLAEVNAWAWWGAARARQERDAQLCALRWATEVLGKDQLRTVRTHDVVTMLGARSLRQALTARLRSPMVSVGCPTRSVAWLLHGEVDLSFVTLAFDASEPDQQAFPHPLLVTVDEVAHPAGRPVSTPV